MCALCESGGRGFHASSDKAARGGDSVNPGRPEPRADGPRFDLGDLLGDFNGSRPSGEGAHLKFDWSNLGGAGSSVADSLLGDQLGRKVEVQAPKLDLASNYVSPGSFTEADSGPGGGQDGIAGSAATSEVLTLGAPAVTNYINFNGDEDFYAVNLVAGHYYVFTMDPSGSLDAVLEIIDTDGTTVLASADGPLGPDTETVGVYAETTGTYYINADGFTTSTGSYTLVGAEAPLPDPIDALNWGGDANVVPGAADTVIMVYFAPAGTPPAGTPAGGGDALEWNAYEMAQVMIALQQYSNVIDVTFQVTTNINEADFKFVLKANGGSTLGQMGPPNTGSSAGIGIFYRAGFGWDEAGGGGLEQGGFGFVTLTHEIGHGLGMAHPHDTGGNSGIMLGVSSSSDTGLYSLNQGLFTVMSYNDAWDTGANGGTPTPGGVGAFGFMGTLGAFDIALMQLKYGANTTYNNGANTYELAQADGIGTFYQTIWDTAGDDTIRYNGFADAVIDLRAATLDYSATGGGYVSYVDGVHMGYTIAAGVVIERGTGGFGNDIITGNAVNNTLRGRDGNDVLNGGDGGDTLIGGEGSDTLRGDAGLDYASYIDATSGVTINLTTLSHGGEATGDTFQNIERYRLSAHADTFTGAGATDYAYGAEGADTLNGAGGIDRLYGQADGDTLNGDAGNDILLGGAGADIHNGGADRDTASYEESTIAITINLLTGVHTGDALGDTWNSVEILWLSNHNDTFIGAGAADEIRGNGGIDTMSGGGGIDTLRGEAGNDILNGEDGDDLLNGGLGADAMNGGNGTDTAVYLLATAGVTINLTSGTHGGEAAGDTFVSIERYQLSNGFTLADSFTGSAGNDWVAGYKGVDTLNGMDGDDTLNGGEHNDVLNGGNGLDKLIAGIGNDTLTGGANADQFYFNVGAFGTDTVTDFENGVDVFRITNQPGIDNISDLTITQNGADVWITLPDGSRIIVQNTLTASIDASDFLWI